MLSAGVYCVYMCEFIKAFKHTCPFYVKCVFDMSLDVRPWARGRSRLRLYTRIKIEKQASEKASFLHISMPEYLPFISHQSSAANWNRITTVAVRFFFFFFFSYMHLRVQSQRQDSRLKQQIEMSLFITTTSLLGLLMFRVQIPQMYKHYFPLVLFHHFNIRRLD